jgi:hypothetical protein
VEDFIVNAAPVVGALIVCAIAWIDVRRAHRKSDSESRSPAE